MSDSVQTVLGLPEKPESDKPADSAPLLKEFGEAFRKALVGVNDGLQVVAAQASQDQHTPLDEKRSKLVEAYQTTSKRIKSDEPQQGEQDISRVLDAVKAVASKVADAAAEALSFHERWLEREPQLDDGLVRIGELEEAGDPKASKLRQIAEAIRDKASARNYQDSIGTLDQLLPKLEQIYTEFQQRQSSASGTATEFMAELESLEQALATLIAEHNLQV